MTRLSTGDMTWVSEYHAPVLAREVAELLGHARDVLDGTLGGGGHSLALLEQGARVTGVDRDADAVREATTRLGAYLAKESFSAVQSNYADVDRVPELSGRTFDAILLDLGVSSHQLDDEGRGFTFRPGALLDMRMGSDATQTAADFLNEAPEAEIMWVLREYGDERRAHRLAREVVRRRGTRPFATSDDFVGAIRGALGPQSGPADFARLFQALRIAVNDELKGLERALPMLRERLSPGGTIAVIAYHSGEDRVVKHAFREWSASCICPPRQPVCTCRGEALGTLLTKRAVTATPEEINTNPRARSARLRAWRSVA
ncbi:MAG: 16S rRNA (cytosine(1402)-N(4))-methyltransferase RsmH [Gemmatimonadaceae bacterium]